jgi:hypothetical protein
MPKLLLLTFLLFLFAFPSKAQKKDTRKKSLPKSEINTQKTVENSDKAIVVDERLAVLRSGPSLFARPIQRFRRGREVVITETKEADGVVFYQVTAIPKISGWIQKEAVTAKFRRGEDERLARLVRSSEGFDQIERARIFLENYPNSVFRPAILLLFGDLLEEVALKLSSEAAKRLSRREMAASGAPLHSFYLNYNGLDRYQRLGVFFLFNPVTRLFHYNGASWREIIEKFPNTNEAAEARKRLDSLKEKMEAVK